MKVLFLALLLGYALLSLTQARRENCALPTSNCSDTEKAIVTLVKTIQQYGKKKKNVLKKGEFIEMAKSELRNMLPVKPNKKNIKILMTSLDVNKDNKVNLDEYLTLIANITTNLSKKKRIRKRILS